MTPPRIAFVTGFPGFVATQVIRRLLADPGHAKVMMLVDELQARALEELIATLSPAEVERIVPLYGKEGCMDLGLAGSEVRLLTEQATSFWHLSAADWPALEGGGVPRHLVDGAREMLAIAREARRLERFCYFSTAFVSGRRRGVILEEELDLGQHFRSPCEELRCRAEVEVAQAMSELPITVFRPTIVVGDSRTGELDRTGVPYLVFDALVHGMLETPSLPGGGEWPLHLVPVDFVVEAAFFISRHEGGVRRTFHLADPNPLPTRRVLELVARQMHRSPPSKSLAQRLTKALLDLTGIEERVGRQRHLLEYLDRPVYYRTAGLLAILQGTPLRCPPFEDYVDVLVDRVRSARQDKGHQLRPWPRIGWSPLPRHRLPIK